MRQLPAGRRSQCTRSKRHWSMVMWLFCSRTCPRVCWSKNLSWFPPHRHEGDFRPRQGWNCPMATKFSPHWLREESSALSLAMARDYFEVHDAWLSRKDGVTSFVFYGLMDDGFPIEPCKSNSWAIRLEKRTAVDREAHGIRGRGRGKGDKRVQ